MNDELKLNFEVGLIRELYIENLMTEEQMNLAIEKIKIGIRKAKAIRQMQKEGMACNESSCIL